jgi:hypothetical protein
MNELEWTKEAPKVAGWYWVRYSNQREVGIVDCCKLSVGATGELARYGIGVIDRVKDLKGCEWFGPFNPPD